MLLVLQIKFKPIQEPGGKAMLYVERDGEGTIIAMHSSPKPNAGEEKSVVDEEILDFLHKTVSADSRKLLLTLSDMGIIRLLEDLIELLIQIGRAHV